MNLLTNDISEYTKNNSDTNGYTKSLSPSLGNSQPVIDLDKEEAPKEEAPKEETPKEETYNIGHQRQLLDQYEQHYEQLQQLYNKHAKDIEKTKNNEAYRNSPIMQALTKEKMNDIQKEMDRLQDEMKEYQSKMYDIKTDERFDNRTDEQIREDELIKQQNDRLDSSYQRTIEDMKKAGLNPMFMQGTNGAGSIGSAGGSASSENDSKRRKRREEERARKEEERRAKQRETQMMLGFISSIMSMIPGYGNMGSMAINAGANMMNAQTNKEHKSNQFFNATQDRNIAWEYLHNAQERHGWAEMDYWERKQREEEQRKKRF